ncbi:MAG: NUDIX hydrolase [Acidimicrobiales bacterium]
MVDPKFNSAVLIPLYEYEDECFLILTRRAANMRSHRHQVSFPGGRIDVDDVDHWDAALREANEEIALDRSLATRVGSLDRFTTVGSDSLIHPEVGVLSGRPQLVASPAEVEHILHVPLAQLLDPSVYREEIWPVGGDEREIYFFELPGDTVWGATASMLRQFLRLITET